MMKPLCIGPVRIDPPVVLAPMAGYTDAAMRSLCREFHCGGCFTEVVNARGILHGSTRTLHLLETMPGERPVAAHIYGSEPAVLAEAAARIHAMDRFDFVDINCGCPVRKIVAKGAGAALIKEPEKIGAIVRAVRQAVPLPVTVKTRIGFSPDRANVADLVQAAQENGAAAITVHARFAVRKHGGEADWDALALVKSCSRIPVIGNGGVLSASDVPRMFARTGVDGVMVGRAAIGNPWVFDEIGCVLAGRAYAGHTVAEHRAVIAEHLARLIRLKTRERACPGRYRLTPEQAATLEFRGHLLKYLAGFPDAVAARRGFSRLRSPEDVLALVDGALASASGAVRPAGGIRAEEGRGHG
jgi:tRNA-dihydrouridine synthase B